MFIKSINLENEKGNTQQIELSNQAGLHPETNWLNKFPFGKEVVPLRLTTAATRSARLGGEGGGGYNVTMEWL